MGGYSAEIADIARHRRDRILDLKIFNSVLTRRRAIGCHHCKARGGLWAS